MTATATAVTLPVDDPRWVALAERHEDATVFHHPRWAQLLADSYGYEARVCGVVGRDGALTAGIPLSSVSSRLTGRRAVGLAFTDFCPPLVTSSEARQDLVQALTALRREERWPRVEVRWDLAGAGVFPGERVLRHTTRLGPDADAVYAKFKKTRVKQPIRGARDAGVVVTASEEWEAVRSYYDLHLRTRRRLGAPPQPLRFFRLVWERLIAHGLGHVRLASDGSRLIAGGVFLRWNEVTTYKFGASEADAWRLHPNHLLLWEEIKSACGRGDRLFDWGRTELGHEGLRKFKSGWGDEHEVTYAVLADEPPPAGGARGRAALAKVIQRSPLWVSRAIGRTLYGHFG